PGAPDTHRVPVVLLAQVPALGTPLPPPRAPGEQLLPPRRRDLPRRPGRARRLLSLGRRGLPLPRAWAAVAAGPPLLFPRRHQRGIPGGLSAVSQRSHGNGMAARKLMLGGAPVLMYHGIGDSIPAGAS